MSSRLQALAENLRAHFGERMRVLPLAAGELTVEVAKAELVAVAMSLRDEPPFRFETLIDLCGVDYLTYGRSEWETSEATSEGFSRAANQPGAATPAMPAADPRRFAVVCHLLSVTNNQRLRLRCHAGDSLILPSLMPVWPAADWYEREAFDLFGLLFEGHPDLRRLLTDYGFIGHPFRKDFPVSGNVEVRYDAESGRVIYQPVSIEPRVLVPKIIRDDNRYDTRLKDRPDRG
ncbi:MAG: NADH-quinone oxidoreductase subunit C [Gammaproteobacteria bacterium]|nr:NADH-quinone oxidoreductase subunit C [Gammaproteobacteria bacterium]